MQKTVICEGDANTVMFPIVAIWYGSCSLITPELMFTIQGVTQPTVCNKF